MEIRDWQRRRTREDRATQPLNAGRLIFAIKMRIVTVFIAVSSKDCSKHSGCKEGLKLQAAATLFWPLCAFHPPLVFIKSWSESHCSCCGKRRENSFSDIFLVVNPTFIAARKLRQNNDQNNCHQSNYQLAITQQVPASLSHSHKVINLPSGHLIAGLPVLYAQQKLCLINLDV